VSANALITVAGEVGVPISTCGDAATDLARTGRFDWPLSVFKVDFNTCH
jgi:hypothetical protein